MKNAIILHGSTDKEEYYAVKHPSMSNSHWIPWLQKRLLVEHIPTATPEIPECYRLDYAVWKREFERFDITEETILVGHSCGGGFIVRWLSENKDTKVDKVVLVAPWIDPDKREGKVFFDFTMDAELVSRTKGVTIFASDNDMQSVQESVKQITEGVRDVSTITFHNHGHFCIQDLGSEAFLELLEYILS